MNSLYQCHWILPILKAEYDTPMPKANAEQTRFEDALRKVLQVSHGEMQQRIAEDKRTRPRTGAGRKPKSSSAAHVSTDKG